MTWKLTPNGLTRAGIPGVPWRDLTEDEYAVAVAAHPGLPDHGYFYQTLSAEEADGKTIAELRDFAAIHGIELAGAATKADITARIQNPHGASDEPAASEPEPAPAEGDAADGQ